VGAELGSTATPGPTHRLLLQCDRRVPGELLRQLLHTAQQSSFAEVQLAVFNGDEGRQAVIDTLPAAVRHFDVRGDPDEMPPLALVLMLNDRGITVAGADAVLRPEAMGTPLPEEPTLPILADGEYDHRQLTRILSYVKDEYPDDERVILVAADGVPYEAVIKALDAARSDPQAQSADGRARTLFPYVVVSTESAMPSVRTPQPNSGGSGSAAGSEGARVGTLGGEVIILGALDKSLVDATVRRHLNQIKYCYVRELKSQPGLAGKVVVKFVIAKDGSVSSATTKSSTMRNPTVEGCINGRFMRFQFPKPKGGGIVIVSYPFLFSPG
jgi:biopolymer transport protein ExbD